MDQNEIIDYERSRDVFYLLILLTSKSLSACSRWMQYEYGAEGGWRRLAITNVKGKNPVPMHFFHHRLLVYCPRTKPMSLRWEPVSRHLKHGTADRQREKKRARVCVYWTYLYFSSTTCILTQFCLTLTCSFASVSFVRNGVCVRDTHPL